MAAIIPKTVASFETTLSAQVIAGDTSLTLTSIVDVDGNNLPSGLYAFTLDGDVEDYKEFCIGTLSGSTLSSVSSISAQGAATSGLNKYHRRGALVSLTDWVVIGRLVGVSSGASGFDASAPLFYDAALVAPTGNQIPTVDYVLSVVNGGPISFVQQVLTSQVAGENLTANDYVYFKESDQRWWKVDLDDATTYASVKRGFAAATQTTGGNLNIITSGLVSGFVGLTAGEEYFASSTAGAVSTTGPNGFIGVAFSTTQMIVDQYIRDIPTGEQKDALDGSQGVPNIDNRYLTEDNTSLSVVDQSQLTANSTQSVGTASTTGLQNRLAQSFTPTKTKIRGVTLDKDTDTGTFTGTVTVSLQSDNVGEPDGTPLATTTLSNDQWKNLPSGAFTAMFANEYDSLVAGDTYWIVIETSTADTTNHPNIGANSAGGYANGETQAYNAVDGWTTIPTIDLYFSTLEGNALQIPLTNSSGFIPDAFNDKNTLGFNRTVGALSATYTKTFLNFYLPFILWTGETSGDTESDFANWTPSSASLVSVKPMGTSFRFDSTNAARISLNSPFYIADGTTLTWAGSNIVIMDFTMSLVTGSTGLFMGLTDDTTNSPVAAYNASADREVAFVFNGTNLYAKTSNASAATLTQIYGVSTSMFNNYRIEVDLGADTANYYINGVLVATISSTFPGTSGNVQLAFGRQANAVAIVTAPSVAIEMNP